MAPFDCLDANSPEWDLQLDITANRVAREQWALQYPNAQPLATMGPEPPGWKGDWTDLYPPSAKEMELEKRLKAADQTRARNDREQLANVQGCNDERRILLCGFEYTAQKILYEHHCELRRRQAFSLSRFNRWAEEDFVDTHDPSELRCECPRCLHGRLLRACRQAWHDFVYFKTLPPPSTQSRVVYEVPFPPDNSHPYHDVYLQLRSVQRRYSPRCVKVEPPRHLARSFERSNPFGDYRWVPGVQQQVDEGDDSSERWDSNGSETEDESIEDKLLHVEKERQRRQRAANREAVRSKRNELPKRRSPRTMEATATMPANAPLQLPSHALSPPHHHHPPTSSTTVYTMSFENDDATPAMPSIPVSDTRPSSWLDTPIADKTIDHALPSNLRDNTNHGPSDSSANENDTVEKPLPGNIFDHDLPFEDGSFPQQGDEAGPAPSLDDFGLQAPATPSNIVAYAETTTNTETVTADDADNEEDEVTGSVQAYAMLRFPDSYCLITSMNLVIIRDETYKARYQMQKKEDKKRRKAEQALNEYAREPSHHSMLGDDDCFGNSFGMQDDGDLEGRPARGLLSNFSEQGGPVSYPADSEDEADFEAERARRRRRKNKANSSSANSVAPQDLSIFGGNGEDGDYMQTQEVLDENGLVRDPREWAQLPVHTAQPEDISKISREHLIFSYDMSRGRWVLNVTGRGVVVDTQYYHRGCEPIELRSGAEIFISTVRMIFELPAHQDDDESVVEVDDNLAERYDLTSTSPVRRLSNALDILDSDAEDRQEAKLESKSEPQKPKPVKIKLTNKKKEPAKETPAPPPAAGKGKNKGKTIEQPVKADTGKGKQKEEPPASPEAAKKPEKGKKPKAASADATGETPAEDGEQPKAESVALPVVPIIEAGSVLADLAPDQMPEKRKGPGRPPKNGLLSKRDESAIKRKQREYERRGEQAPELQTLLNIVRAEQRAKDLAAKAAARGEAAPDMPIPSIETANGHDLGAGGGHRDSLAGASGSPANGLDRASPKAIRRPKSPSPIKPESEFTEEEMKKPNMTYIYIIDEILQNMEGSQADLQTIYDKIQKRWPYYKYRVNSVGWQSSVRHNLLQCDRFKEAGKSGKGRFWTINFDHPLDNKKKRPTPPPRPPQAPMQNGQLPHGLPQMGPNQYGQSSYPAYGQAPVNGQAPYQQGQQPAQGQYYNSPYNGQNAYGGPQRPPSNGPQMHGGPPGQQQYRQPPPPPPPPQAERPYGGVVDAIMAYRAIFLGPYAPGSPEFQDKDALLNRVIGYYSDQYHGNKNDTVVSAEEASKEPYPNIKAIFDQHKDLIKAADAAKAAAASATPPAGNPQQNTHAPPNQQSGLPVANGGGQSQQYQPPINGQGQQPPPPPPANGAVQQPAYQAANAPYQQQAPVAGPSGQQPGPYSQPPPAMGHVPNQPPAASATYQPTQQPPMPKFVQYKAAPAVQNAQASTPANTGSANTQQPPSVPKVNSPPVNAIGNGHAHPSPSNTTPQSTAPPAASAQAPVAPPQVTTAGIANNGPPVAVANAQPASNAQNSETQNQQSGRPSPAPQTTATSAPVQQPALPSVTAAPAPVQQPALAPIPASGDEMQGVVASQPPPTGPQVQPAAVANNTADSAPKSVTPAETPTAAGVKRPAGEEAGEGTEDPEAKRQKTS